MHTCLQNVELKESGPIEVVSITNYKDVVSSPLLDSTTTTISKNMDSFTILPDFEPNSMVMFESTNLSSLSHFILKTNMCL